MQGNKKKIRPGLDWGGCTLVNAERSTLIDDEGLDLNGP